ncbi:MAG: hypothetical protein JNK58_13645 [Phycisphaerae bacterium]|nr:hypothetical protein [Phycisphaerae bacterium]
MQRIIALCLVVMCVSVSPAAAAESAVNAPFNRVMKLMDSTYQRFEKQSRRQVDSALRRIDILKRSGVSPDRITLLVLETKISLELAAVELREDLSDFNIAAGLVVDRHERTALLRPTLPTINFDTFRRRADQKNDTLDAKADRLLDSAFARLDAALPVVETPEEPF